MNIEQLNECFTDIYYYLHEEHHEKITHQAVRILQQVLKEDEVSVKDVAVRNGISHNTASEHVKRLLVKGLLLKKRKPTDERAIILYLTPKGIEVLKSNTELAGEKLERVLVGLSSEERNLIEQSFHLLAREAKICFSSQK
ncbi:MarR family winged helix-turn-helix transcriptional regulator [Cytobacillus spongiae]|uniref:MarR family winged helix-turn-helix transcriptional regulator n=1 Tax=Cytobacillus spongiae TaxID=2901381 RepID=UPI001F43EB20|nr:MarR family winged helix-turn-helix transcriptional regulator [Cytobacillus spongiae]UII54384.1 MarR family winged helix-turn-helix transcriptional regulator [Cytobacillus spongiae]